MKLLVLLFIFPPDLASDVINLGGEIIKPIRELIYLGLPMDSSAAESRKRTAARAEKKLRAGYMCRLSCQS